MSRILTISLVGLTLAAAGHLQAAKKALDDLEEELRRSGGLPGWGRE